ncbi:MAG: universal stress protein [Desulfobacterales bacterium]|nr:universal stress protein [Desulfobacterales bacterium]
MGRKILLPYNFTQNDEKALGFVISTFAGQQDVDITLFNSYMLPPEIDLSGSPVMDKLSKNVTYLKIRVSDQEEALKKAKEKLVEGGFSENQVSCLFKPKEKDTAQDITNAALKGQFNIVVINRKPGKIARFFVGSVFDKVVTALKDVTICIVT